MKMKFLLIAIPLLWLISCNNSLVKSPTTKASADSSAVESLVNLDDIIIDPKASDAKVVEVYRTDIQEKCERRYLEAVKSYQEGDLKIARLCFDNLLEHLEYFYGDEKLSDSLMLTNFVDEFDADKLDSEDKDIFQLYSALYAEENGEEQETELQVQESKPAVAAKNGDSRYTEILKSESRNFLSARGIKNVDDSFLKDVAEAFEEYASDRIKTREIILRAARYESFVKGTLKKENLDPFFFYIPAVMTTYYNEKNNGGIWGLDNTRSWRKIRNDVGASTALVVGMLKSKIKSSSAVQVMSEIVKERNYSFNNNFTSAQILNSDFAGFLAIALILENPDRYGFKDVPESAPDEEEYASSYQSYAQNPETYVAEKQKQKVAEKSEPVKSSEKADKKTKKDKKGKEQAKIKYTVQKGDNLQKVAALFKVGSDDIAEQNPKAVKKQKLFAGTVLLIKTSAVMSYQAKSGDNMGKICQKFGMSNAEFMDLNNLDEKKVFKGRRYYVYKN